jgi:PAS domain S-box-containing protein
MKVTLQNVVVETFMPRTIKAIRDLPYPIQLICFTLIYIVAARFGLLFAYVEGNVSLVWPSTGYALALLMVFGYRYWPVVAAGAMLVNLMTDLPLGVALITATGNSLEALVGVYLLRRARVSLAFDHIYDVVSFIILAGIISTMFSATFGVTALALDGQFPWSNYGLIWGVWWLGDAMSMLVIAPVLLIWVQPPCPYAKDPLTRHNLLFWVALAVVSLLVFNTRLVTDGFFPLAYITFPFLVWAALRFSQREVALCTLVIATIAILGTIQQTGPFIRANTHESLFFLWSYISTVSITAMLLAAALAERKQAEHSLLEAARRFESIYRNTPVMMHSIDAEGRIVNVSQYWLDVIGYEESEVIGRSSIDFLTPDSRRYAHEVVLPQFYQTGQCVEVAYQYVKKNGEIIDALLSATSEYDAEGKVTRSLAVIQDVTQRKRTEDALRRSEARFRAIFEGANIGITVVDRDAHPVASNEAFTRMLGYSEAELCRMAFREFTHPEDVDNNMELYHQLMQGEINHYGMEKRYIRKDGGIVWVRINVSQFPGAAADNELLITIVEDITDQKRAEAALYRLNAELEQRVAERTAKLSAANDRLTELDRLKSKFIADVSHELRTPLAVLNTRVYLLEHSKPEKRDEYLNGLRDQIERLTRFVNSILDLSRLELGRGRIAFGAVNLNDIVEHVSAALAPRAEINDLTLVVHYGHDLPPIYGEYNQIAQVATNLIANAVNYTPDGTIDVSTAQDGEWVYLRVQDTGMGITSDDIPHLFERFYRGERAGQSKVSGTGLGLSIVKEIVDLHNGRIEVVSQIGKGTTFTVRFPIWQDNIPALNPPEMQHMTD